MHNSETKDMINDKATLSGFKGFASLVNVLGTSTKINDKLNALSAYFSSADDTDKVWVIAIFSGRRPKRAVNSTLLQNYCVELTGLPIWLFEESYHTVGDLAENIALLLPAASQQTGQPTGLTYYLEKLIAIEKEQEPVKKSFILECWDKMDSEERFVFNKLITGGFRIGVSQKLMVNALAKTIDLNPSVIAHRISGNWNPASTSFDDLLGSGGDHTDHSKPYPFYLAHAIEDGPETLGEPAQWQAEWKWDGIRGQLIKRNGELFVWSRGEELMTDKFPEYQVLKDILPNGTAIDGEIICLPVNDSNDFVPLPFSLLQTRIGRKNISKKQLMEAPAGFIAYDLLEYNGEDQRTESLEQRRVKLEEIILSANKPVLKLSPVITFDSWETLAAIRAGSRERNAEGLMLKRKSSAYQVGRKRGDWWKWKVEPLVIDAVMIYAQKGHGRRSNLYTDYTFAVRDGDRLLPFTKAYSGLTDKEFAEIDQFVKKNAIEKFGPVRTVKPELVFEIAFEGIALSNRHKSGIALRFPRMNRWRKDKKASEINTLDDLKKILEVNVKSSKAE